MRTLLRVAGGAVALTLVLGLAACDDDEDETTTTTTADASDNGDDNGDAMAMEMTEEEAAAAMQETAAGFLEAPTPAEKLEFVDGGDNEGFADVYTQIQTAITDAGLSLPVTAADIRDVEFNDDMTEATATYSLNNRDTGEQVIPEQVADFIFVDGQWLLTATAVCDLSGAGAQAAGVPELEDECYTAADAI